MSETRLIRIPKKEIESIYLDSDKVLNNDLRATWEDLSVTWKKVLIQNAKPLWNYHINYFNKLNQFKSSLVSKKRKLLPQIIDWRKDCRIWSNFHRLQVLTPMEVKFSSLESLEEFIHEEEKKWSTSVFQHFVSIQEDEVSRLYLNLSELNKVKVGEVHSDIFLENLFATLKLIKVFNCRKTTINTLQPLELVPEIKSLSVSDNEINDLSSLAKLNHLKELYCINIRLDSLNEIASISSLEALYCGINPISTLVPLSNCRQLKYINCRKTKVKKHEVKAMNQNLPNCKVDWKNYLISDKLF